MGEQKSNASLVISVLALVVAVLVGLNSVFDFFGLANPGSARQKHQVIVPFLRSLNADNANRVSAAGAYTTPGSQAELYSMAHYDAWRAFSANGGRATAKRTVKKAKNEAYRVCDKKRCQLYGHFVFDQPDMTISSFDIDNRAVSSLVVGRAKQQSWKWGTIQLIDAYETGRGLNVTLRIGAYDHSIRLLWVNSTYTIKGMEGRMPLNVQAPQRLAAWQRVNVYLHIPKGRFGGDVVASVRPRGGGHRLLLDVNRLTGLPS